MISPSYPKARNPLFKLNVNYDDKTIMIEKHKDSIRGKYRILKAEKLQKWTVKERPDVADRFSLSSGAISGLRVS